MSIFNKESMFIIDNQRLLLENDRLRAEVASLKEENALLTLQVQRYCDALEHIAQWSQELQDDAVANGLVLSQWRGCVAYATAALTALPQQVKSEDRAGAILSRGR